MECDAKLEGGEKVRRVRGRGIRPTPPSRCFSCSYVFVPSPQSERLEKADETTDKAVENSL